MRKFLLSFGLLFVSIALGSVVGENDGISTGRRRRDFRQPKLLQGYKTPMHKALFTQRGYIQFLRWELPVPEIEEFTFCLWVKSTNLTYSHSIFSYSKDEKHRLVSSWISPFGRSIHLEIGKNEIIAHPTDIEEHRWYHICQSWDNKIGRYALWIDGRIETEGYATQLVGHVIPRSGDIVVGQEYTDFDKGFEEGIEGAVVGFNFLLSSAFDKSDIYYPGGIYNNEENLASVLSLGENRVSPKLFPLPNLDLGAQIHPGIQHRRSGEAGLFIPDQGRIIVNDRREGMFDSTLKEYLGDDRPFGRNLAGSGNRRDILVKFAHRTKRDVSRSSTALQNSGRTRRQGSNPLGLELVNLSYSRCELGRGSPFIGGSEMLISWTRTPVKVFGGAILKDTTGTCGNF